MALCLGIALGPKVARACGGFFSPKPDAKPTLAHEQVLMIFDPAKGREHFIRRVVFDRAREHFGFVIPTPSRPEVEAVEKPPFDSLRAWFRFEQESAGHGFGGGRGFGGGGGGVRVLEVKQVGSFKAFTLEASDSTALAGWLKKNGLVSTAATDAWLAHYVGLGFYYVALRYDPPAGAKSSTAGAGGSSPLRAETLRISFDTPLPYYPYLEPEHDAANEKKPRNKRLLDLWLVSPSAWVPVALRQEEGKLEWVRPLKAGVRHEQARARLERVLSKELTALLPKGELVVQTFQDQKVSRAGFGDIVFVPHQRKHWSRAEEAKLQRYLPILDPALGGQP